MSAFFIYSFQHFIRIWVNQNQNVMIWAGSCSSETSVGPPLLLRQSTADYSSDESIQSRRLNGSSVETPSYQNLHRELLLSHKRYSRSNTEMCPICETEQRVLCVFVCGCMSLTLSDHTGACCWRRNQSWSECWRNADLNCTRRRRWLNGGHRIWRQSSARGSRSWKRSEAQTVREIFRKVII